MAGQAELKILVSVVNQSAQALNAIRADLKNVMASFADLSKTGLAPITAEAEALAAAAKKIGDSSKQSSEGVQALNEKMQKLGEIAKFAAGGFLALESVKFLKDLADTAARTQVLGTVLNTVAFNAGVSRAEISKVDTAVQKLGITASASRQALSQFVQSGLKVDGAEKLARVAQDTAVISGKNSSQEFSELITAIQEVSVERLRYRQIIVNEKEANQRYVEEVNKQPGAIKKSAESLTGLEKQQALLNEVIRVSARTAGVYQAALGDVGKQLQSLARYQEALKVSLGNALLPAYLALVEVFTELLKELKLTSDSLTENTTNSVKFGEAVRTIATGLKDVIVVAIKLKEVLEVIAITFVGIKIAGFIQGISTAVLGLRAFIAAALAVAAAGAEVGAGVTLASGPIGIIIALLAGLYVGLDTLAEKFPAVKAVLAVFGGGLVDFALTAVFPVRAAIIGLAAAFEGLRRATSGGEGFAGFKKALKESDVEIQRLRDQLKEVRSATEAAAADARAGGESVTTAQPGKTGFGGTTDEIATSLSKQKDLVHDLTEAYVRVGAAGNEAGAAVIKAQLTAAQSVEDNIRVQLVALAKKKGFDDEAIKRLTEGSLEQRKADNEKLKALDDLRHAEQELFNNKFVFDGANINTADFAKKVGEVKLIFKDLFEGTKLQGDDAKKAVNELREAFRLLASATKNPGDLVALKELGKAIRGNGQVTDAEKKDTQESEAIAAKAVRDAEIGRTAGLVAEAKARQQAIDAAKLEVIKQSAGLVKAKNEEAENADKGAFDRGLLSLEQYYANRKARLQSNAAEEEKISFKTTEGILNGLRFTKNETERLQVKTTANVEIDRNTLRKEKEVADELKLDKELATKKKELLKQVEATRIATAKTADPLNLIIQQDEINKKYDEELQKLKGVEGGVEAVNAARKQALEIAQIEHDNLALQKQIDLQSSLLSIDQTKLNAAKTGGLVTDAERIQAENSLLARRIDLVRQQIAQQQKIRDSETSTPEQKSQAEKSANELQAQFINLANQTQSYGKTLEQQFSGNLTNALDQFVTKAKTAKEALRGLALSTLADIGKIASTNLSQGITRKITESTSSAGGNEGVFGKLGALLGDGSKPGSTVTNPLYTLEVGPGGVVKNILPDASKLVPGAGPIEAAGKSLFDSVGSGFETLIQSIGSGFTGLIGLLTASAGGQAAGSVAGGAGGFLSGIGALFAATGGSISGPGNGTSDSIPAMLSNGEFVVNAESAKKFGPLLHALNEDKVEGMTAQLGSRPIPKFAGGGAVGNFSAANSPMQASTRIINTVDPDLAKDFMESPQGERVVLNHIRRNNDQVRQLVR